MNPTFAEVCPRGDVDCVGPGHEVYIYVRGHLVMKIWHLRGLHRSTLFQTYGQPESLPEPRIRKVSAP